MIASPPGLKTLHKQRPIMKSGAAAAVTPTLPLPTTRSPMPEMSV
jgi:hypothetical protein